jgi:phospholipid-binding lipoprotein MlaA
VELGIRNAFHNARVVPRLINNLLQGKFKGAGIEAARFLINSSFGIGGLFDFAKEVFDLDAPDEDTGQTLGFYGIKPGPYLVLPFLPPLTLRDAFGYAGDYMLDPINYFVFAVIRVGQPALVTHQTTATLGWFGMRAGEIVNERSINLELFQGVEEGTVDLYGAVRNAYLQRRARQIRE